MSSSSSFCLNNSPFFLKMIFSSGWRINGNNACSCEEFVVPGVYTSAFVEAGIKIKEEGADRAPFYQATMTL